MLVRFLLAVEPATERHRLERLVRGSGIHTASLRSGEHLLERLAREDVDLVLISRPLLGRQARDLITSVRELPESPEIIVLVDEEDAEVRAQFLATGVLAVLNRSLSDASLRETLASLSDRRRTEAIRRLRADRPEEQYSLRDFLSASPSMQHFLELARKVARSDTTLLILGETGVGKERLARAVHAEGPRAGGPFMAINCGAIPETLLESELFGHDEGAFTGASRSRRGYFELAHHGTIFLDEIGEMPLHLQVKLLRVLQDRAIRRIGGEKPIRIDVRIMAASNRDLEAEMKGGRFRADLFFRLAVVSLRLPSLRERTEDIPMLANSYLKLFRTSLGRPVAGIEPAAMDALLRYEWPGNVRELINVMEQTCLLCAGPQIGPADLPHRISLASGGGDPQPSVDFNRFLAKPIPAARRDLMDAFEVAYLTKVLGETRGRVGQAADRAGLNPRSLHSLMKRHRLRKEAFKN